MRKLLTQRKRKPLRDYAFLSVQIISNRRHVVLLLDFYDDGTIILYCLRQDAELRAAFFQVAFVLFYFFLYQFYCVIIPSFSYLFPYY